MNALVVHAEAEPHTPPHDVYIKSEIGDDVSNNDNNLDDSSSDDLEYEENPLIIIERNTLLEPTRRQPELQLPIMYLPVAATPIFDVLTEHFIDAFAPDDHENCGSSSAIRRAGSERMFTPLLSEAFHAVSVAYFARGVGSRQAMDYGYRVYCRVLQRFQHALADPSQSRSSGVLATTILLMAYESLQHTSERALIKACINALKLIEFRNPWNHMFGVEHLCFTELLPYWVCTALVLRKPTFLARREWKVVPWSAPGIYKDIMASLLEQVVDLPAILWRHDQYKLGVQTQSKPLNELNAQLKRLCTSIREFEARLQTWKRDWLDDFPARQPFEVRGQGEGLFPIFQYIDPNSLQNIQPLVLVYPNPQIAQTMCIYYATMLILSSVDTRADDRIPGSKVLEFAHLICRSLEYYISSVPGNMINRLAFPLRVAYDSLPGGGLERRFVEEVFQLVARKNALRSWGRFIPDISTK